MRVHLFLCLLIGISLAQWQGTWNDGKRNFGGSLYLCTRGDYVYGSYSGAGLLTGQMMGNKLVGEWHEAGYMKPYGSFELVLDASGNSFTGTWKYTESDTTFSWSGSKSSSDRPSWSTQCLVPSAVADVDGVFNGNQNICLRPEILYHETNYGSVYGNFAGFGLLHGYTNNGGKSAFMSNFEAIEGTSLEANRPETSGTPFGPDFTQNPSVLPGMTTDRIAIGVAVDAGTFCGFFWKGLYNNQIGDTAICMPRSTLDHMGPTDLACGVNALTRQTITAANGGLTRDILDEVQRAFNNIPDPIIVFNGIVLDDSNDDDVIVLPDDDDNVVVVPDDDDDDNNVVPTEDDDDDGPQVYVIYIAIDDSGPSDDDDDNTNVPAPTSDDDDDNNAVVSPPKNYIIVYMDDDDNGSNPNPPVFLPVPQVPTVPFVPPVNPVVINVPVFVPTPGGIIPGDDAAPIIILNDDGAPVVIPAPISVPSGLDDADVLDLIGSPSSTLVFSFGLIIAALLI